jgi:phosphocarrier protein HPr
MKRAEIIVPWNHGLHARQASLLVRTACKFASTIQLKHRGQIANARSIMSLLLLCATMGSTLQVEVQGDDEDKAIAAVERLFSSGQ